MWHTALLRLQIQPDNFRYLTHALPENNPKDPKCRNLLTNIEGISTIGQHYNGKYSRDGVTAYFTSNKINLGKGNECTAYQAYVHVNFAKLMTRDEHVDLPYPEHTPEILSKLEACLKDIFAEYEPPYKGRGRKPKRGIKSLDALEVSRIDYTTQIEGLTQDEINAYIRCLNKGDLSKLNPERTKKGYTGMFKGSAYMRAKTVTVNIYDKADEMRNKKRSTSDIKAAEGVLRIEIQCKRPKITHICKQHNIKPTLQNLMNPAISKEVISYYLETIGGTHDYLRADKAAHLIKASDNTPKTMEHMIFIPKYLNNNKTARLSEAKEALKETTSQSTVDRTMKALKVIEINPVTLPVNSQIRTLPNLLTVVQEHWKAEESIDHTSLPW